MDRNLKSGEFLVSMLNSSDERVIQFALESILKSVHYLWIDYVDHIAAFQRLPDRFPALKKQVAFCLSQIFFYMDNLQEALYWAVSSEDLFNIQQRNLYTDTIISLVINKYIVHLNSGFQKDEEDLDQQNSRKMFEKYERIITNILESSFSLNLNIDKKILIGLSIETEKFQFVSKIIRALSNDELTKTFDFAVNISESKRNSSHVFKAFLDEFSKREKKDYLALSKCCFALFLTDFHADLILEVFKSNVELCYQILSDIQDIGSVLYCQSLAAALKTRAPANFQVFELILLGKLKERIQRQFLAQSNNVDRLLLKNMVSKWRPKDSLSTVGITLPLAISLFGTQDISLLKESAKQFGTVKNWSLFTTTGSLGLIFSAKQNFSGEARELTLNEQSPFYKGGLLFAEGLSNFGLGTELEHKQELLNKARSNDEAIAHGAIFSLGLRFALSNDPDIIWELKKLIHDEKANQGEAAGFALGLVKAGHWDQELAEEFFNASRNNPHDRIARATMAGVGLMALNSQLDLLSFAKQHLKDKDFFVRFGAVGLLAVRYFSTGNSQAVKELLAAAGTDLSNDVRRLAVLAIAFVMLRKKNKLYALLKMLSSSYNAYVRHAVALGLGLAFAHSFDRKAANLLRRLLEDKTDFVRQAAGIGMGLVYQLGNEHMEANFESTRKILSDKLDRKFESGIAKVGYNLGFALMQAGGGNCTLGLRAQESWSGAGVKPQTLVGCFMFCFYWYWFPMVNFIGLALEPNFLVGVNKDLKVPRSFQFNSKAPKKFFEYYKTAENVEDKQKEAAPVVLSITKRAKARLEKPEPREKTDGAKPGMIIEEGPAIQEEADKKDDKKTVLANGHRVLRKQANYIDFAIENRRYEPVFESKKVGILFLKDTKEGESEEFLDDQGNKAWLVPPPKFQFNAEDNK